MKFPERFRWVDAPRGGSTKVGDPCGIFIVKAKAACGRPLKIIASAAGIDPESQGWDHASVTVYANPKAVPTWDEMCIVKDLFWNEEECVVQFHPPRSDYVNTHPGCLHLWRNVEKEFPRPPKIMV